MQAKRRQGLFCLLKIKTSREIRNPQVGGSSPPAGSKSLNGFTAFPSETENLRCDRGVTSSGLNPSENQGKGKTLTYILGPVLLPGKSVTL